MSDPIVIMAMALFGMVLGGRALINNQGLVTRDLLKAVAEQTENINKLYLLFKEQGHTLVVTGINQEHNQTTILERLDIIETKLDNLQENCIHE